MNCEAFRARLADFVTGRLDADARREFVAHIDACAECAEVLRRRRRPPRLVAAGFVGAFAASVFTLIYTGLNVGDVQRADDAPAARAERPGVQSGAAPAARDDGAESEPDGAGPRDAAPRRDAR